MTSAVGRCQYCGPQGAATVAHDWDQLQRQLDDLRAEVERLRGQSKAANRDAAITREARKREYLNAEVV
jgi:outer membrane murein-binding lipoprotein Lpp